MLDDMIRTLHWKLVSTVILACSCLAGCTVDDEFLEGKPCASDGTCAGGYSCVREPCPDQPGYLCPVCRKNPSPDGGLDGGDGGGDEPSDGGDPGGDRPAACEQDPPPCKSLPGCEDVDPVCQDGQWRCETGFEPEEHSCDGLDNDCDGATDRGLVCILAGNGSPGLEDGAADQARFDEPRCAVAHPEGGLVVADRGNHVLRRVMPDGAVTTLAGTGSYGHQDGPAGEASFYEPSGLAVLDDGSILIADRLNHRIRRLAEVDGEMVVDTVAGTGFADFQDGPADQAQFAMPTSLALGADGSVYVADSQNHCIRRIAGGEVSTFAGRCEQPGFVDGAGTQARFNSPTDLLMLDDGSLVVSEESSHTLRLVAGDGAVSTLAGTGEAGFADGPTDEARFWKPAGCLWDPDTGRLLVADSGNHRVRAVEPGVEVTTRLGTGDPGLEDGPPLQAGFKLPSALAFLGDGRLVIVDTFNHALRVVHP